MHEEWTRPILTAQNCACSKPHTSTRVEGTRLLSGDLDIDVLGAGYNVLEWFENDGSQSFADHGLATPVGAGALMDVVAADVGKLCSRSPRRASRFTTAGRRGRGPGYSRRLAPCPKCPSTGRASHDI
jgi:hypothetical protein